MSKQLIRDYISALKNLYGIVSKEKVVEIYNIQNEEIITIEQETNISEKAIYTNDKNQVVYIPDENLKQAIKSYLPDSNDEITKGELESITQLHLYGSNIKNIPAFD